MVGLFEAREVEGARDEVAGDWVRGGRRLDGVERAAVVLGGVVLVSLGVVSWRLREGKGW